ncbi:MAG: 3-hydroxyacyl-ACP dehydratase FabZ [Clostridia bacterium]|nr:3-hydroxyacyl-ACP dehydratase FabZ [Clostridia bacterium]
MKLNRDEIMKILPHRPPMLLVDEAELGENGESIGKYTVKGDEHFLQGHFPGNPIVPGVILCEMMAQSACVMFKDKPAALTLFTGMNNVHFKKPVVPGDTVVSTCTLVKSKGPFHFCKGEARVNGEIRASLEFSFALVPPDKVAK